MAVWKRARASSRLDSNAAPAAQRAPRGARRVLAPRARGAVATPAPIAARMAARALSHLGSPARPLRVLDAGCGDGRLLAAVATAAAARQLPVACTGIDIDAASASAAQALESALRQSAVIDAGLAGWHIVHGDFLAPDCGERDFDIAIANPPYVAWRDLEAVTRTRLHATPRVDLAAAFLDRILDRLRPGGTLVAIVPNKLLVARYAAPLRQRLRDACTVEEIWDLSRGNVFGAHAAYPVVLVVRRTAPAAAHASILCNDDGAERGRWSHRAWTAMPDCIVPLGMPPALTAIASRLLAGPRFATHTRFACGIAASGFGRAVGGGSERLLRARDVAAFRAGPGTAFDAGSAGLAPASLARMRCPKVVVPGMFRRVCAAFDAEARLLGRVYWSRVADDDQRVLMLALLNSRLVALLYAALFAGAAQSGGWLRANAPYLAALPWPGQVTAARLRVAADCVVRLERSADAAARARLDVVVEQMYGLDAGERRTVAALARLLPAADTSAHESAA